MSRTEWFNPTRFGVRSSVVELKTISPVETTDAETTPLPRSDFTATPAEMEMMARSRILIFKYPDIVRNKTLLSVLITRAKRLISEDGDKLKDLCSDNLVLYVLRLVKKDRELDSD